MFLITYYLMLRIFPLLYLHNNCRFFNSLRLIVVMHENSCRSPDFFFSKFLIFFCIFFTLKNYVLLQNDYKFLSQSKYMNYKK